jgi:ABC-2 type transport system permease protein
MSATRTEPRTERTAPRSVVVHPVSFPRVVTSEWLKFRTVRSTLWTGVAAVGALVGIALLLAWASTIAPEGQGMTTGGSVVPLLGSGVQMAQLAVAVLGVLVVTSEYSTGMVRSSFAAVPSRLPTLAGKAIVLTLATVALTLVAMVLAYVVTLPFHDRLGVTLDLGDAETWRLVAGLPLYLVGVALLALAFGALIRHTAGALTAAIGLLLVVENVVALVPLRAFEVISPFLPATAGARIMYDEEMLAMLDAFGNGDVSLSPWQGYGVMMAWVTVLLVAAGVLLRRRDA